MSKEIKLLKEQISLLEQKIEFLTNAKISEMKCNNVKFKSQSIPKYVIVQKIETVRKMDLGKVGDIIIKILKELLEE